MSRYQLKFEDKDHYLFVTVHGELNPMTDVSIDEDIRRECENRKQRLVLIDIRPTTSRLDGIENHIAAITIQDRIGPYVRAIAIIDTLENRERSEMYELTAVNRGATVKFFEDCESAASWLLAA